VLFFQGKDFIVRLGMVGSVMALVIGSVLLLVVSSRTTWFDSMKNRSFFAFLHGAGLRIPKAF
jgi:hypothetical protein